jgi:PAS domain S-box-containing protein
MPNCLVQQILEEIERDYAQPITLRTISATIGRQPAYLGRVFQHEVGSSVRDYLTRVRLEHAAELVRDGVKIEAVALSVGYRSKKNFYQRFKGYYGTTPVQYRIGSAETPSERERQTALRVAGNRPLFASTSPDDQWIKDEEPKASASEPVLTGLGAIVRASNRAWRLAARAQEAMLQQFKGLRVGILLTNDAGRYVASNRAAVSLTGYSTMELSERSPSDLFTTAPAAETRCVWQLVTLGRNQSQNAVIRTKAGDSIGVLLVTLKNVLWGRSEMSAMLERAEPLLAR